MVLFLCKDCNLPFDCSKFYIIHRKGCHDEDDGIKCPFCLNQRVNSRRFSWHINSFHEEEIRRLDRVTTPVQSAEMNSNHSLVPTEDGGDKRRRISGGEMNGNTAGTVAAADVSYPLMVNTVSTFMDHDQGDSYMDHLTKDQILKESFKKIILTKELLLLNEKQFLKLWKVKDEVESLIKNHKNGKGLVQILNHTLSSTWRIDKFIKDHFNSLEPLKDNLSGKSVLRFSIGDIVKNELTDSETFNHIQDGNKYEHEQGNPISCFRDTASFKENMVHLKTIESPEEVGEILYIFLELFLDDFNCFDPLGNTSDRGKLLGVYLNLLDIPLKYRLKRTKQKLVTLIPRSEIDKYKIRPCLNPIVEELMKLGSDGIELMKEGKLIRAKVIVVKVTGDSLGIFELLGLGRNWKGKICRVCKATKDQIQDDPSTIGAGFRTNDFWEEEVKKLARCEGPELKVVPAFYELSRFMSFNSMYTSDKMHNLALGIYPDFLAGWLPSIVDPKVLDKLSETMESLKLKSRYVTFKRTSDPRNDYKSKGHAASQYGFFTNLPEILMKTYGTIFGDKFPIEFSVITKSPQYKAYLLLRKIDWFVNKTSFTERDLQLLDTLVMDFIVRRHGLGMDQSVIPKLHYLTHVTHDIKTSGPLILYDTIRYERRHQSFKQKARTSRNSLNLSYSFGNWDKRIMALLNGESNDFHQKGKSGINGANELDVLNQFNIQFEYKVRSLTALELTVEVGEIHLINRQFIRVKMIVKVMGEFFQIIVEVLPHSHLDQDLLCYVLLEPDPVCLIYEINDFFGSKCYRSFTFHNRHLLNKDKYDDFVI